jgi:hypothetical protein
MFFIRHLHHGNWYQYGCGFAMAHSKGEVQKSPSKKFNTEECEMQKNSTWKGEVPKSPTWKSMRCKKKSAWKSTR